MRFFLLLYCCIIGLNLRADTLKKVQNTPVSASLRHVLLVFDSTKIKQVLSQCSQHQVELLAASLQQHIQNILLSGTISIQDIYGLERIIEQMKNIVVLLPEQKTKAIQDTLQELSINALSALDSLVIGSIDQDIAYIKNSFMTLFHHYSQGSIADYKISLRILAIIEELLKRYDGILISAYTAVVLFQVAFITFLLQVS